MGGHTFKRKAPFARTSFKKGGEGLFSRVGLFLGDYGSSKVPTSSATGDEVNGVCNKEMCKAHSIQPNVLYRWTVLGYSQCSLNLTQAKLPFWCSAMLFSCQIKSGNGDSWIAYGPADREREYETKPRVHLVWKTKNTTSQMLLYSGLVPTLS